MRIPVPRCIHRGQMAWAYICRSWKSVRDEIVDALSSIYACDASDSSLTLGICTGQELPPTEEVLSATA